MAEIALLLTEEYERRIRVSKDEEIDLVSCMSILTRPIDGFSWAKKAAEDRFQLAKRVLEPKTDLGLATINGLFSA
uniref:Uncharacterized protein n=1 Tax=Nelumbo nucifera TaxID=4432 RepID=A0A822XWV1_NELNU|nr:TPA_asm: hypothetical protein HUJ06_023331 [Nelumbo nucifera]